MTESESRYQDWMVARARQGLLRDLTPLQLAGDGTLVIGGITYVNLSANDYLGLSQHPDLITRSKEWAEMYGAGAGASRLVTGNLDLFEGIEGKVAALKNKPAALVMASGFQTNAGVLQALLDKQVLGMEPLVFADRLNHSSMHFGCQAAGVRQRRYRHCDMAHLATLLEKECASAALKFILTESVFSMDGDVAPMDEICALARDHDALVICDDAHATGVLGEGGCGLSGDADIVIGTFSKALGSYGAYVACSQEARSYLVNRCTALIYSTALPPPVLGAIDASLDVLPHLDEARAHVADISKRVRQRAAELGFDVGTSRTQIQPLIVGGARDALELSDQLKQSGFWATPIRPPTVPENTARLRLAFSAVHSDEQIERLLETLALAQVERYATA